MRENEREYDIGLRVIAQDPVQFDRIVIWMGEWMDR